MSRGWIFAIVTAVEGCALGVMAYTLGLHGWREPVFMMSAMAIIVAQYAEMRLTK